jgi:hypothetical protein
MIPFASVTIGAGVIVLFVVIVLAIVVGKRL